MVAAPAIVSMAAVVGRKIGIFPRKKDNWLVVPNLWGAIVGGPGAFKTPTIAEALRAIERLCKAASEEYQSKKSAIEAKEQALTMEMEAKKEDLKKSFKADNGKALELENDLAVIQEELKNIRIVEKRYKTNDATIEKIGHLLRDNPNGLLLFRDELAGWIRSLDKSGREGDREFYLESWNGTGAHSIDRVGNGTVHIPALCLSIFGGIQPGKFESLTKGSSGKEDDGFLQRFQILVYPDLKPDWQDIDREPNEDAFERVSEFFSWLDKLEGKQLSSEVSKKENIPGVRFSDEALEIFRTWRTTLENRLQSGELDNPAFEAHLAKYRSLVPTLALLFWLPEVAEGESKDGVVSKSATELAIRWADFLEQHARRVYFTEGSKTEQSAKALAKKITAGLVTDGTALRSICRHNWSYLGSREEVEVALAALEELGWVRLISTQGRGSRSQIIKVHPKLQGLNLKGEI
jgi:putative DNA primase/helicase